jgi:hypothetical protein
MPALVSETSLKALLWFPRVWPLALALFVMARQRSRAQHRVAAFVFCSLVAFGVQWIIASLLVRIPVSVPTNLDHDESVLRVFVITGWRNLLISVICSIPLVIWLHHFFLAPKSGGTDS